MNLLQDGLDLFFFFIIYLPLNLILMLIVALVLSIVNRAFRLNFPTWIVAFASALLVFIMMFAFVESISGDNDRIGSSDIHFIYYFVTIVINILLAIILLAFSGLKKLIFRNTPTIPFVFNKPQVTATIVYGVVAIIFGIMPLLNDAKNHLDDIANEKYLKNIKQVIDSNDINAFKKALAENYELYQLKLDTYSTQTLFEYTLEQNKHELVHLLVKNNEKLLTYNFDWNINSPEMLQVLLADGMSPVEAVEKLTAKNKPELTRLVVEKYHPRFETGGEYVVSYITRNVFDNKDSALFNYLIENGLTKNITQTSETVFDYIKNNDLEKVKMLVGKGFRLDSSQHRMITQAIVNENIPMLAYLFKYPFNPNNISNEYTYVEHAVINNSDTVIDYLLKLHPDVTTLHHTNDEGNTNALLLAEKLNHTEILARLKNYAGLH